MVDLMFLLCDAPAESSSVSAPRGKRQVLIDLHCSRCSIHRILEDTSEEFRSFVFRQSGDILPVHNDRPAVHRPDTGDRVQTGTLASTISTDDRAEVSWIQLECHAQKGRLFVDGSLVECFPDMVQFQHQRCVRHLTQPPSLPLSRMNSSTLPADTAQPGRSPPRWL